MIYPLKTMLDCNKNWYTFLVVLLALFGCITAAPGNYRRPTKVGLVCCEAVSKALIPSTIKLTAYKHQNALNPCVEAIIFFSKNEKYCSDPNARWIPKKLKGLTEIKE
ncbi:chemokine (C-C motif) ligand 34b, duplicate 4 [Ictalurus furcatus]|uniref:chemokine (C-C motif) ligand 34b, duplicate 4 n=1 Tax=Ictalurus furcatus TaxID=66913 RepID=UPI0023500F73|nr:chemokine (C-C motif) ligand 34b, duplicate 4 [Ictalurus furcatus]